MKQFGRTSSVTVLSVFIVIAFVLASCGTPTPAPPIEVIPGAINTGDSNKSYVDLQINSVHFLGTVNNYSDTGKLQLITVVADDSGHAAAPEAIAAGGAWAVVGFLTLDTILGYAGSKVQAYFQKNYVIGTQSFSLSRQYNWNNGEPISAQSTNGQVNFTFEVQQSPTA